MDAHKLAQQDTVTAGIAMFHCSIGVALGDLASGLLSQLMPSMVTMAATCLVLATGALWSLRETYGVDLEFNEPEVAKVSPPLHRKDRPPFGTP